MLTRRRAAADWPPASADEPLVQLRDVRKTYDVLTAPVRALRGVDLEIAPGEFVALAGASGSGKSTLLSVVAGLDRHDDGLVMVAGLDLGRSTAAQRAELRRRHVAHRVPVLPAARADDGAAERRVRCTDLGRAGARGLRAGRRPARPTRPVEPGGRLPGDDVRRRAPAAGDRACTRTASEPVARRRANRLARLVRCRRNHRPARTSALGRADDPARHARRHRRRRG